MTETRRDIINLSHPSVSDKHDIGDSPRVGDVVVKRAHLKGRRPTQEDADASFECDFFKYLTQDQQTLLINNVLFRLNEMARAESITSGSCVGLNVSWRQGNDIHICSANVADVSTFEIFTSEDNVQEVIRINESLHGVDEARYDPVLAKKLKTQQLMGETILRLKHGQMIYRSLGDFSAQVDGLEGKADIVHKLFTLKDKQVAYLLTGCDGFTDAILNIMRNFAKGLYDEPHSYVLEYNKQQIPLDSIMRILFSAKKLNEQKEQKQNVKKLDIEKLLQEEFTRLVFQASLKQCKTAKPGSRESNLAWNLAQWGLTFSSDNISVMVHNPGKMAICTAIMDGHGGDEMAEFIQENLESVFLDEACRLLKETQLRQFAGKKTEEVKKDKAKEESKSALELASDILYGLDRLPDIKPKSTGKLFKSAEITLDTSELQNSAKRFFALSLGAEKKPDIFIDYIAAQLMHIWNMEVAKLPPAAEKKSKKTEQKEIPETNQQKNQRFLDGVIKNKEKNNYIAALYEISKLLFEIHNRYELPNKAMLFQNFPLEYFIKAGVTIAPER